MNMNIENNDKATKAMDVQDSIDDIEEIVQGYIEDVRSQVEQEMDQELRDLERATTMEELKEALEGLELTIKIDGDDLLSYSDMLQG